MQIGKMRDRAIGENKEKTSFMERNYRRYYDGYAILSVRNAKGKERYRYVYCGDYYSIDMSEAAWKKNCVFFMAMAISMLAAFLAEGLRFSPVNMTWYTTILQAFMFPAMILLMYRVLRFVQLGRRMKRKERIAFFDGSRQLLILLQYLLLGQMSLLFLYVLIHFRSIPSMMLHYLLSFSAYGFLYVLIRRMDSSLSGIRIVSEKNTCKLPEDAVVIKKIGKESYGE